MEQAIEAEQGHAIAAAVEKTSASVAYSEALAGRIEQAFPRLSWSVRRNCRAYLRPFCALTTPAARNAFNRSDSKWWEVWK